MNILINKDDQSMLARAVEISLFTWRRALPSDPVDDDELYGWWGDTYAMTEMQDRIGSRLWLLRRRSITTQTLIDAKTYIKEALQWLIDDGVVTSIDIRLTREQDRINAHVILKHTNQAEQNLEFSDLWRLINAVQDTNPARAY